MRTTALWWWIDRWRKSTAFMDMNLAEQGAYRNLLDEAALRGGPLPDDDRILAKACGDALAWKRMRVKVLARFTLMPDGWRNDTLDAVLQESKRRADKQRDYRNKRGNADGNAAGNKALPPDPDPDLSVKNVRTLSSADADFELFRTTYPKNRRVGGAKARSAYLKACQKKSPAELLIALEQHNRSEQWQNPKLVPGMLVWLHQERWLQELPEATTAPMTPAERAWAVEVRRKAYGRCPHEPRHDELEPCLVEFVQERRAKGAS